MKDKNNIDYNDYRKGCKIASQIGNLMQRTDVPHQELDEWLRDSESSKEVSNRLSSEATLSNLCANFEREEKHIGSQHLTDFLKKKRSKVQKFRMIKFLSASSAAAVIALSFLIYNLLSPSKVETCIAETITTGAIKNDFDKPTLILNNGNNIDLTKVSTTNLTDNQATQFKIDSIEYNTIVIPKKYNYTTILADGTTVHMNSCSELRYPTKFGTDKREVFLSGEAFFEVKKGDIPFIVTVNDVSVRVYGTKFNINAYNNGNILTALIEGSVSIQQKGDSIETFIKPNQSLTIDINGTKTLNTIIPERYTAWMDGFIRCDEEPMANLLEDIAKWYGVEFTYNQKIKKINISASFNRERPLTEMIEAIELISGVKITKTQEEKYMVE